MDYRLDEKGKYYTVHVSKRTHSVHAYAYGMLITGKMHIMPDNRVKDELNNGERFIAITHAEVHEPASGKVLATGETLILNKDQVVWLVPVEEEQDGANTNESQS